MSTPPAAAAPMSQEEERSQAKLMHIINGFFPVVGGLIFWLIGKDRSAFIDTNGKEAVNFGITVAIGLTASAILMAVVIGFLTYPVIAIGSIVLGFQMGGKAGNGEEVKYPMTLRLIK